MTAYIKTDRKRKRESFTSKMTERIKTNTHKTNTRTATDLQKSFKSKQKPVFFYTSAFIYIFLTPDLGSQSEFPSYIRKYTMSNYPECISLLTMVLKLTLSLQRPL